MMLMCVAFVSSAFLLGHNAWKCRSPKERFVRACVCVSLCVCVCVCGRVATTATLCSGKEIQCIKLNKLISACGNNFLR